MLTMNQRGLVRTSVSSSEPLTLSETKLYLRVDGTAEDSLITDLITVAREHAESYLRRSIIDQSWRMTLEDYAPTCFRLPMGPVRSITSISLVDNEGGVIALSSSNYELKTDQDEIELTEMVYAHMIQITYATGYASSSDIPKSLRYGMLSHIASLFECRGEGEVVVPKDALALYSGHKEILL